MTEPLVDDAPLDEQNESAAKDKEIAHQDDRRKKDEQDYRSFLAWKNEQAAKNTAQTPEDEDPEVYMWLANGDVKRIKTSELPTGGHQHHGHYEDGNKVHTVVAVHPVEIER